MEHLNDADIVDYYRKCLTWKPWMDEQLKERTDKILTDDIYALITDYLTKLDMLHKVIKARGLTI